MKYPGGSPSTMFCEQVGTVTSLFEQWNDCERTVVLYALLKRVPFANLKFLQLSIEYNLAQHFNSQTKLHVLENNSNNAAFLTRLLNQYKNFKCNEAQLNKDSIIYESNNNSHNYIDNVGKYDKKEDILNDILTYLPLLKPGNDDAKLVYLSLIPTAVDDSVRQIVPLELVQQMLSYLLIHPAITNEDRRSLSQWLRHLEDHISLSYVPNKAPNYFLLPSESTSPSSSVSTWQAVAPPQVPSKHDGSWDLANIQVTQDFCDEVQLKEFRKTIGKNLDFTQSTASSQNSTIPFDSVNEDHHISFSKNGTEILDYDCDDYNKSNTQIAYNLSTNLNEFLMVPNFHENNALKTRRSNSLTTTQNTCSSSSSENLSNISQKPRSFSLSMESPRDSLTSSGSETRLDDYNKINYLKFTTHNIGMGNIAQWLKSLRLHKYIWLFSNITYEQMMDITETYLESVGVTKGARNKLVLCIQKLKERYTILLQFEKDLLSGKASLNIVLEELLNMVLTPMKPADHYNKEDVAGQLIKTLDLAATILSSKTISTTQDEDNINNFLTVLERALHSEAFVAHTNLLKEHKFKISKIRLQFTPKGHYNTKTGSVNGGLNKSRWNSGTKQQQQQQHKTNGNSEKSHRKNSIQNFPIINIVQQQQQTTQLQQQQQKKYQENSDKFNCTKQFYSHNNQNGYNKSSSYPNFNSSSTNNSINSNNNSCSSNNSSNNTSSNLSSNLSSNNTSNNSCNSNSKTSTLRQHSNNSTTYHRHSLNNLINYSPTLLTSSTTTPLTTTVQSIINSSNNGIVNNKENRIKHQQQQQLQQHHQHQKDKDKNIEINDDNEENYCKQINSKNHHIKSSIGDINSRLEFLCLQMTEQAIN